MIDGSWLVQSSSHSDTVHGASCEVFEDAKSASNDSCVSASVYTKFRDLMMPSVC